MKKNEVYSFTVVLKNVSSDTPGLEDSLFECGCDDALINYRDGAVYLDFDRQAGSREEAIITAIKNIRSSSVNADIASISPGDYVTPSEIAKRLNTNRQTVSMWIKEERRKAFPHPIMRINESSPLWSWVSVTKWLYDNQKIPDRSMVQDAELMAHINAALDDCDMEKKKIRHDLVSKIMGNSKNMHKQARG